MNPALNILPIALLDPLASARAFIEEIEAFGARIRAGDWTKPLTNEEENT